jgi:hypothetical protein
MPSNLRLPSPTTSILDEAMMSVFQYLPPRVRDAIIKTGNLSETTEMMATAGNGCHVTEIQFQLELCPMLKTSNNDFIDLVDLDHNDW